MTYYEKNKSKEKAYKMRPIKFRGFAYDGEMKSGWLSRKKHGLVIDYFITDDTGTHEVITETIGLYTGIHLDDIELCEGDIIQRTPNTHDTHQYIVTYDTTFGRWVACKNSEPASISKLLSTLLEVFSWQCIGNVHESKY